MSKITNIVANADLGFPVLMDRIEKETSVIKNAKFPGVVYKNLPCVKSVLLFASGKVVFTGAKNKDFIDIAFEELRRRMMKYNSDLPENLEFVKQRELEKTRIKQLNFNNNCLVKYETEECDLD